MQIIEAIWTGPYSWPGFENENNLPSLPKQPGLYLQTFEYENGYLIYAAGLTRRAVSQRMREHTRKYRTGDYNVLSINALQRGVRREVWHGWGWTAQKRAEFSRREAEIAGATNKQLSAFRLFAADIGTQPRILERLEAAIMNALYQQPSPLCDVPDKGMMLAPRWESEAIITVHNQRDVTLYGLPDQLEI